MRSVGGFTLDYIPVWSINRFTQQKMTNRPTPGNTCAIVSVRWRLDSVQQ